MPYMAFSTYENRWLASFCSGWIVLFLANSQQKKELLIKIWNYCSLTYIFAVTPHKNTLSFTFNGSMVKNQHSS